jgi:hypothetical protein
MSDGAHLLADELERLLSMPLLPGAALRAYYQAVHQLHEDTRRYPRVNVPEKVWHDLMAADMRATGSESKSTVAAQERFLRAFIASLRSAARAS